MTSGRWADLGVRLVSGLVLAGLGGISVWSGGLVFVVMTAVIFALMAWELAAMTDRPANPGLRLVVAGLAGVSILAAQGGWVVALLAAPLVLALTPRKDARLLGVYGLAVMLSAHEFIEIDQRGAILIVWLVGVVVASDIMGYFIGRLVGGPKFWPKASPKKTWSGTVAGWVGAALVGLALVMSGHGQPALVLLSPLVGFAGQLGDIAESLLKRRAGIKDASRLIPGHGGVLDRFDALVGAVLAVWLWQLVLPLPIGGP
ncbi:phosphatidate cytidylyltransferase [Stagnihabitans tardus]|uniref:Phosphatidate cytidylyltransferase n=1 Tax=Stagnihabitans tardus TaxID=2699202 RepID=A0AAE5BW25_9RHOB|nr:phosphatidate cytidylyltransferase [Stagnihabitans tardus]NBZ87888.1 phosphatidate cytidylyltransferase [Stagnihabitans tardus]